MSNDPTSRRPRRDDYEHGLQSIGTFIDVEVDDLMTLAQRANHFAGQRATESLRVSRIMSRPVRVVGPDVAMSEAAHLMVIQRISGLPVVDETGR